ncbi:MAG: Crp/Fnr family transcriptional regulator [Cyclobacteriaceae bacterium]|nr:Crp/Fnr family transcriptional regulator [Cyclobacteriaceae bacterium]MCK5209239.1 Crp/Fnr family transcriptional regulator [Cyclobacteriaceae bacterium]MCK5279705.1 Crp/Fnr family transcriptional regulator [Cyclobacteriaceae bacterium]MCK5470883.1 Crp/Fnr family transcriptional regulator [Cyclobacteriaceae bacterium]
MDELLIPNCTSCKELNKLFCGLSLSDREVFSQNKRKNTYRKGQVIYYEGNYPQGIFCIYHGKIKISTIGRKGKEQIVKFKGRGEVLGYRALLNDEPYNATATAISDCEVCHISKNAFLDTLEKSKHLSLNTIRLLSNDLKESEQKLINLSQKPVKERVAEALLLLKDHFGLEEDGKTIEVNLTRREIGEIAGITTETTIRILSELSKEKILKLEDKKISIMNIQQLVKIGNNNSTI